MKKLAVCHCAETGKLYREYKDTYNLFVPMERTRYQTEKDKVWKVREEPLIRGFCFAPLSDAYEARRRLPGWFRFRIGHLPLSVSPMLVPADELYAVQRQLNHEFDGTTHQIIPEALDEPDEELWFKSGDHVSIQVGCILAGMSGIVERPKKGGTIRLRLDGTFQFVEVHKRFLRFHI